MNKEKIIRNEAIEFVYNNLDESSFFELSPKEFIKSLKKELYNFYQPEYKMFFLDQINISVQQYMNEHNNECPKGENCEIYSAYEKILFYIDQEINELPKILHKTTITEKAYRKKVFISYSHEDKDWLVKLKRHFKPFEGKIDFWDDTKIKAGQKWKEEIINAIAEANVAILLLSADFFNSKFITENELPPLLKAAETDGATILSVIIKPCLFEEYPEINQYQAINSPQKTIIQMSEADQEITWIELVRQIKEIIKNEE